MSQQPLLEIAGLKVTFGRGAASADAVAGVDLTVAPGEVLGIVGESGSGKSVTMLAAMGLTPKSARIGGSVRFRGQELVGMPQKGLRAIRGARMAMIFQDPLTSLNPVLTIGAQVAEALRLHNPGLSRKAAMARAVELLALVSIPEPERRVRQYPHEFSGGMRQRAMIAMAVANSPDLLIADEPTTALDVTVQAQIMEVLKELRERLGIGLVLITHDLGVVAGAADRIAVMYGGRVVEQGKVDDVFYRSRHPYTRGLLASIPKLDVRQERLQPIEGAPPSLTSRPSGCPFHPRCPLAEARCSSEEPLLRQVGAVETRCHFAERLDDPEGGIVVPFDKAPARKAVGP
ncbi:peptide/nickel transport system ATP-binding protein/peptide/nickel transport system ATP-binding protein [Tistlia consotensis]|uniref:Peptide/nickel transport system ATP-binding protein/peptide/nickel transport system ATP-binding protein n=1 Tax=Tistlia consotensis USBA 355 TaxID=560819 RepID=A0A1Y6BKY3_9PROT|nr:ABC transporter ATP-binding protein [Tistlia consotensis]SMF16932.1 peptide/nickel transport system ATP-binding protein/peptide/nickel transport system ATP-binding protein [Tistlia consotensis USBA 355]SNR40802.1 peptide/nickel transport system ATP-binding protein/peptide/nickel transport system ATP-binding protein [Tistlia consotensis]